MCFSVNSSCMEVTSDMLTRHDTLRVVTRAYLDPATALAPAATSFPPFVILAVQL